MGQAVLFGAKIAVSSTVCGAAMSAVAWGTRYVSQIPTVEVRSAAIAGSVMTGVSMLSNKVLSYLGLNKDMYDYVRSEQKKTEKNNQWSNITLAKSEVGFAVAAIATGLGFLVSTGAVPRLASLMGGNISYGAVAIFNVLNILPTSKLTEYFNRGYDYSK